MNVTLLLQPNLIWHGTNASILEKNPTDALGVTTGNGVSSDNKEMTDYFWWFSEVHANLLLNMLMLNPHQQWMKMKSGKNSLFVKLRKEENSVLKPFDVKQWSANAIYFTDALVSVRILCGGSPDLHCLFRSAAILKNILGWAAAMTLKKKVPQRIKQACCPLSNWSTCLSL